MLHFSEVVVRHLSGSEVFPSVLKEILQKERQCRFQVKGQSMWPFIRNGDFITVSSLGARAPSLGDVVVFTHPKNRSLLIHRVVQKRDKTYSVKGDSARERDGTISISDILGYVTRVERRGKRETIGLGPERYVIALLTRKISLQSLSSLWKILRAVKHFFVK